MATNLPDVAISLSGSASEKPANGSMEDRMRLMRERFKLLQENEDVDQEDSKAADVNEEKEAQQSPLSIPLDQPNRPFSTRKPGANWDMLRKVVRFDTNKSLSPRGGMSAKSPMGSMKSEKTASTEDGSTDAALNIEDIDLNNFWMDFNVPEPYVVAKQDELAPVITLPPEAALAEAEAFESYSKPLSVTVSRIPEKKVEEQKKRVEEALEVERQRVAEENRRKEEDAASRALAASDRVKLMEAEAKERLEVEREKLIFLKLEKERDIGAQFRHMREKLESGIRKQHAAVQETYGRLLVHEESLARKFEVFTRLTPQPIEFRIHLLRAVKTKLVRGSYALMLTQFDSLGGRPLSWSGIGANGIGALRPGITSVFRHSGRYFDRTLKVEDSCFALCPPRQLLRPGFVFVLELFQLAGRFNPTDRVVAWTALPMAYQNMSLIEGKIKLPLLKGEHGPGVQHFKRMESAMAMDLSAWMCNMYLEVRPMSLRELGVDEKLLKSTKVDIDYFNKTLDADGFQEDLYGTNYKENSVLPMGGSQKAGIGMGTGEGVGLGVGMSGTAGVDLEAGLSIKSKAVKFPGGSVKSKEKIGGELNARGKFRNEWLLPPPVDKGLFTRKIELSESMKKERQRLRRRRNKGGLNDALQKQQTKMLKKRTWALHGGGGGDSEKSGKSGKYDRRAVLHELSSSEEEEEDDNGGRDNGELPGLEAKGVRSRDQDGRGGYAAMNPQQGVSDSDGEAAAAGGGDSLSVGKQSPVPGANSADADELDQPVPLVTRTRAEGASSSTLGTQQRQRLKKQGQGVSRQLSNVSGGGQSAGLMSFFGLGRRGVEEDLRDRKRRNRQRNNILLASAAQQAQGRTGKAKHSDSEGEEVGGGGDRLGDVEAGLLPLEDSAGAEGEEQESLLLNRGDSFAEHRAKLITKWKENIKQKMGKLQQGISEDGDDDGDFDDELAELRERGYDVQDEIYLHEQQRGKLMGVEAVNGKLNREWAGAGHEGRIVRRWQSDGPRFDSEAIDPIMWRKRHAGRPAEEGEGAGAGVLGGQQSFHSAGTGVTGLASHVRVGDDGRIVDCAAEKGGPLRGKSWAPLRDVRELEDYSISIGSDPARRKRLMPGATARSKVLILSLELFGDLVPYMIGSFEFYATVLIFAFAFWLRIYIRYLAQYLYVQSLGTPVYNFSLEAIQVIFKYSSESISTSAEVGVVAIGPIANICVFLGSFASGYLFYKFAGFLPEVFSKLFAAFGVATLLDPTLTLLVDLGYHNYLCPTTTDVCRENYLASECKCFNGDFAKLWYRMERIEGSGITGLFITMLLYSCFFVLSLLLLYEYLVHVHKDGRILDIWRRITAPSEEFFMPHDYEVSQEELNSVCNRAVDWRGPGGVRRKLRIASKIVEDVNPEDPSDIDLASYKVYTVYEIDGKGSKSVYRQFTKDEEGVILEVFHDSQAGSAGPKLVFGNLLEVSDPATATTGAAAAAAAATTATGNGVGVGVGVGVDTQATTLSSAVADGAKGSSSGSGKREGGMSPGPGLQGDTRPRESSAYPTGVSSRTSSARLLLAKKEDGGVLREGVQGGERGGAADRAEGAHSELDGTEERLRDMLTRQGTAPSPLHD